MEPVEQPKFEIDIDSIEGSKFNHFKYVIDSHM